MGQYQVRHQCDRPCADCIHYNYDIFEDDFGTMREEYCNKGHNDRVGYYSEVCKDYKEEE